MPHLLRYFCKPGGQHTYAPSGSSTVLLSPLFFPYRFILTLVPFAQTPPPLRAAPIIVDEESAVPESVAAAYQEAHRGGGLLASSDYGNLLASMSGYEKTATYAYGK